MFPSIFSVMHPHTSPRVDSPHPDTLPLRSVQQKGSAKLMGLFKQDNGYYCSQPVEEEPDTFMQNSGEKTPKPNSTSSDEDVFYTPKASQHSATVKANDEDEITPAALDPLQRLPYVRYLQGLSDSDLTQRKHVHKQQVHTLKNKLYFWQATPDVQTSPDYINIQRQIRKHQAEHDLVNAECVRRDIQDGLTSPPDPEQAEAIKTHIADCAAEVEDYWQREDEPPQLTEPAIQFLTSPHPNGYIRYIQGHSEPDLQNRRIIYKRALAEAEKALKDSSKQAGLSDYAYQLKQEPKGMDIFSLFKRKQLKKESNDPTNKGPKLLLPLQGRSIFGDAEMTKLRALGEYKAELYMANAEDYRRNVNRGKAEFPTQKLLDTILSELGECANDVVTDFKPQPDKLDTKMI